MDYFFADANFVIFFGMVNRKYRKNDEMDKNIFQK
jgi:hypothetical protein